MTHARFAAVVLALLVAAGCPKPRPADAVSAEACAKAAESLKQARASRTDGYLHRGLEHAARADRLCASQDSKAEIAAARADLRIDGASVAAEPKANEKTKREALILYRDGIAMRLQGKNDVSIQRFEKSLAKAWHPLTFVQIGETHKIAGNDVEARKAYARALALAERRHGRAKPMPRTGLGRPILGVAYDPMGRYIAMAVRDGRIVVSDATTGREVHSLRGSKEPVAAVAFRPDGKQLASASFDGAVRLWNVKTGAQEHVLRKHTGAVLAISYSADGKRLASGGWDAHTHLWDPYNGKLLRTDRGNGSPVKAVAVQPDGTVVAMGTSNGIVRLVDTATGQLLYTFPSHAAAVTALAYSDDGSLLASGSADSSVRIWDVAARAEKYRIKDLGRVAALDFANHGEKGLVLAIGGRVVSVWEATNKKIAYRLEDAGLRVLGVALGPGGRRLVAGAVDGSVRTYDVMSSRNKLTIGPIYDPIADVAVSPDGRYVAVTRGGSEVVLWSLQGKKTVTMHELGASVGDLAFAPDGSVLLVSGSKSQAIPLGTGAWAAFGAPPALSELAFSGDGRTLATVRGSRATLHSATGEKNQLDVGTGGHLAISPNGDAIMLSHFASSQVVRRTNKSKTIRGARTSTVVRGAGFLADGSLVLSVLETSDAPLGGLGAQLDCEEVIVAGDVRLSRRDVVGGNGRDVMIRRDDKLQLYDMETGQTITLGDAVMPLLAYESSRDGRLIATARGDGVLRLYGAKSGLLARLATLGDQWIVIAADGRVTGSENAHTLFYWQAGPVTLPGHVGWQRQAASDALTAISGKLGATRVWSKKVVSGETRRCVALVSRGIDPMKRRRNTAIPESDLLGPELDEMFGDTLVASSLQEGGKDKLIQFTIKSMKGSITRAELTRALGPLRRELDHCMKRLKVESGTTTIAKLVIGPTGAVLRTDVDNFDQKRGRCIWGAFGDMKFSKRPDGKQARVVIQVIF